MRILYNCCPETYILLFDNAAPDSYCAKRSSYLPTSTFRIHLSQLNEKCTLYICCTLTTPLQTLAVPSARCTYPHIHVWYLPQSRFERKRADRPTDKPTDRLLYTMKGTKVQTLGGRAVAGAWLVAWALMAMGAITHAHR